MIKIVKGAKALFDNCFFKTVLKNSFLKLLYDAL